jgi:HK97 gp10 family phage protein
MTVEGLKSLERKLKRTIPAKAVEFTRKAMEDGANEVVSLMKNLVPVDKGALRDSIAWTWGNAPKGALVLGRSQPAGDGMRITIYAGGGDEYYAWFVEFGTHSHINQGLFAGSEHPGTAAQPFFFVSWRAMKRRVKSRVTRQMRKGIREGAQS